LHFWKEEPMRRSADFTIQGFLYQFNKTLLEILRANDEDQIIVEGPIEDIDIASPDGNIEAIQCKYHEAQKYTPSVVYKPLLQMMMHFGKSNKDVSYRLFAHFPLEPNCVREVTKQELSQALESKAQDLQKLIQEILSLSIDLDAFRKCCVIEFGPSFNELERQVLEQFKTNEVPSDCLDEIFYPNAANIIARLSMCHSVSDRTITKPEFLGELLAIRKTAISKWTFALKTRRQILTTRKKQLKENLSRNSRDRCFIISEKIIDGFSKNVVTFIQSYLSKYHFKPNHDKPPTFCLECDIDTFQDICCRLWKKGITSNDGIIAGTSKFDEVYFYREPLRQPKGRSDFTDEFDIRITCHSIQLDALANYGFDDVFVVGSGDYRYRREDVEVEHLPLTSFTELKYVLGLSNVIE
jgi:hypothetical protein